MQTALMKNRSKADEFRVSALYESARELFFNPQVSPAQKMDESMWRSRSVTTEGYIISTCTDAETGIYVQLVGPGTAKDDDIMLTFGQKFCQEGKDLARQNIATKIWS